jgi:hypothetical protein
VSQRPPYFEGFVFLGELSEPEDQLRAKILSGQLKAYIYSTKARGDFEPVPISAAAFSVEEDQGWENFSSFEPEPKPFQIMTVDRDMRRRPGTRWHVRGPHWIYLLKADLAPRKGKGGRKPVMDQNAVAAEVERLMDYHGEFRADDPEWNAEARLKEAIRKKFGEAADSTIESYIKAPLAKWRQSKRPSPKT